MCCPIPVSGSSSGEFAHNLRAALDNLLWQLVLLRGGSPTIRTQFPIEERRERYQNSARSMLRGVSADDRTFIESVQPYHLGSKARQTYLALLQWLSNVDKHRFVHIGCAMPETLPIPVYGRTGQGYTTGLLPWFPELIRDIREVRHVLYSPFIAGYDRAELARIVFSASGPDPQMEMQGDLTLDIVFSDPQRALVVDDLGEMQKVVGYIVESFRPRFDI